MTTLAVQIEMPTASDVSVSEDTLSVNPSDGRTMSAPIEWFPCLVHATPKERRRWRLIGNGQGIHWEDIHEDVSVGGSSGKTIRGKPNLFEAMAKSQGGYNKRLRQYPVQPRGAADRAISPLPVPVSEDPARAEQESRSSRE